MHDLEEGNIPEAGLSSLVIVSVLQKPLLACCMLLLNGLERDYMELQ